MDAYLESRRLREELHAAEPSDVKSARDLMVSYMKGGETRMLLKEVAAAQIDYQKALTLADELARNDPQSAKLAPVADLPPCKRNDRSRRPL